MKMKLLLCKNVPKLGIVGEVVEVAAGYGRNYLVPCGLATAPTETNVRALAEARRIAEEDRIRELGLLKSLVARLEGVEVTIRAKANEDGVLYGSVGPKEIAQALQEEGHPVFEDHVSLHAPIRHLDNISVELKLGEGLCSTIKVWVVREKVEGEDEDEIASGEQAEPSMEAGANDTSADK